MTRTVATPSTMPEVIDWTGRPRDDAEVWFLTVATAVWTSTRLAETAGRVRVWVPRPYTPAWRERRMAMA